MSLSSLRPRSVGQAAAAVLIASVLVLPNPAARADNASDGNVGTFAVVKWVEDYNARPVAYNPGVSGGALLVTDGFRGTNVADDPSSGSVDLDELSKKEFTFTYQCDDAARTTGTLKVKGDAKPVESPALPAGTTCLVGEDLDSAQAEGYDLKDWDPSEAVTIKDGEVVGLYFANYYAPTPNRPTPTPSPTPTPDMPAPTPTPDTVTPSASAFVTPSSSAEPSPSGTTEVTSPNGMTPSTPPAPSAPVLASTGLSLAVAVTGLLGVASGAALLVVRRRA